MAGIRGPPRKTNCQTEPSGASRPRPRDGRDPRPISVCAALRRASVRGIAPLISAMATKRQHGGSAARGRAVRREKGLQWLWIKRSQEVPRARAIELESKTGANGIQRLYPAVARGGLQG